MSDPQAALRASWKAVVSDLLAQSEQPSSDVPNFSHSQRLNLQLVEPIMIGDGYALIAAPHENAKNVIEAELGEYITRTLSQHMGRPCSLAVTIAAPPQPAHEEAPEAPAPQRPIQTEAPEHGMGHQAQGFQQPMPPTPSAQPETPSHHQPRSWDTAHSPASLDE
ncbi:chromosomal replication initiator protein DnaA, partial [Corynebacterium hesseae]